jgi:hypothetical protein
MLERMTFLLGISVSIIGWLFSYITTDLTSTPVLYHFMSTKTVGSGTESKLYSIIFVENLSRHAVVPPVTMTITTSGPKDGCIKGTPLPEGVLWTKNDSPPEYDKSDPKHASVIFRNLMPGSSFQVDTPIGDDCDVHVNFSFNDGAPNPSNAAVRILSGGIEVFIIQNFLNIIVTLVLLFSLVFIVSFVYACVLSWRGPQEPPARPIGDEAK